MDDLEKQALKYANTLRDQPPLISEYSTATGLYCKGKLSPICDYTNDPNQLFKAIFSELKGNPSLDITDFKFYSNSVDGLIKEARIILINQILEGKGNPILRDKEKVINNMGEALDIQFGRDEINIGKNNFNIYSKLEALETDDELFIEYRDLHNYYKATKHRDKNKFTKDLRLLGTMEGRIITIKFFETVRQILQSYFVKKGYKLPQELEEIDYSNYGFKI